MSWQPGAAFNALPGPTPVDLESKLVLKTCILARAALAELNAAVDLIPNPAILIYSRELIDVIFEQPYSRIGNLVSAGIAKRQTASDYLARLTEIGVVPAMQSGREKLFIRRALLDLLASETHEIRASYAPAIEAHR